MVVIKTKDNIIIISHKYDKIKKWQTQGSDN